MELPSALESPYSVEWFIFVGVSLAIIVAILFLLRLFYSSLARMFRPAQKPPGKAAPDPAKIE